MNTRILSVTRSKGAVMRLPFLLITVAVAAVIGYQLFFASSDSGRDQDKQNEQATSGQLNTPTANPWDKVPDNFVPAEPIPPSQIKEDIPDKSVNKAATRNLNGLAQENLSANNCSKMLSEMRSGNVMINDQLVALPIVPATIAKLCDHNVNTIVVIPSGQMSTHRPDFRAF